MKNNVLNLILILSFLDKETLKLLPIWRSEIERVGSVQLGETKVDLTFENCGYEECNLGNFQTDAMIYSQLKSMPYNASNWSNVTIAFLSNFEFLTTIPTGVITYNQVFELAAYDSPYMVLRLQGEHLLAALEHSVADLEDNQQFLQVAGLKIIYNLNKPRNARVIEVHIRCGNCAVPMYVPLNKSEIYSVITSRYLALGNLGYNMLLEHSIERKQAVHDLATLNEYIIEMSPIYIGIEGRLTIMK